MPGMDALLGDVSAHMLLSLRCSNNALLRLNTNLIVAIFTVRLLMSRTLVRLLICRNGITLPKAFATLQRLMESERSQQAPKRWKGNVAGTPFFSLVMTPS